MTFDKKQLEEAIERALNNLSDVNISNKFRLVNRKYL